MSSPIIAVAGLVFEYPGLRALDEVDLAISPGRITALVGPNGAGKSTLLRCLAGLDRPLAGSIRVAGVDVAAHPRLAHRKIGYLSDFFGLYDELRVEQGLRFIAETRDLAQPAEAITNVARQLDLTTLLEQRAGRLSRGQRQRVAIAQAIIHQPEVLLLDEPASGLDPEARHHLGALFLELRDQGMSLLVSSHILAELDEYATEVLILDQGRVVDHYALQAEARQGHYWLELVSPFPRLATILAAMEGVKWLEGKDTRVLLRIENPEPENRRKLLAALMEQGAPVCGLGEAKQGLQETYLRKVKKARGDES